MAKRKKLFTALIFLYLFQTPHSLAQSSNPSQNPNPSNTSFSQTTNLNQQSNLAKQQIADKNSDECKVDEDIRNAIIDRIKSDPNNYFKNLAPCYRQDRKLAIKLSLNDLKQIEFIDDNLKSDENFFLRLIKINPEVLQFADKSLLKDDFFMERATFISRESLKYADPDLLDNKIFIKKMIEFDAKNYVYASDRLKQNRDIAKAAFSEDGSLLFYAPDIVKSDKKLVEIAFKNDSSSIQFAAENIKNEKVFRNTKVQANNFSVEHLEELVLKNYVNKDSESSNNYINKGKFAKNKKLIDREFITKWSFPKLSPNEIQLNNFEKRNFPAQWKKDLKKYPKLVKKIENFFIKRGLDKKTVEQLNLTYLWKVENKPLTFAFNLYSLRENPDFDLGLSFVDVTSLTAIASFQNNDWDLSVIETILDQEIETNIEFKNGHKKFLLWDIITKSQNEYGPKLVYKVEEKLNNYLEIYSQKSIGKYELTLRYKY